MNSIILPEENKNSRKGEQGRVLIVGGSHLYYGAPIMNSLGAEKGGTDLIHLFLPSIHAEAAKNYSLNFQINPFHGENIGMSDVKNIIELSKKCHSLVLGSGMIDSSETTKNCILKILENTHIPTVIDAGALFPEILNIKKKTLWVITPHDKEFERIFSCKATEKNLIKHGTENKIAIVKKGKIDKIIGPYGECFTNKTGHHRMRVGGTGDVLAGFIGSLISQGMSRFEACKTGTFIFGKCGETLSKKQYSYTAEELANTIPLMMKKLGK